MLEQPISTIITVNTTEANIVGYSAPSLSHTHATRSSCTKVYCLYQAKLTNVFFSEHYWQLNANRSQRLTKPVWWITDKWDTITFGTTLLLLSACHARVCSVCYELSSRGPPLIDPCRYHAYTVLNCSWILMRCDNKVFSLAYVLKTRRF